jgi:hypothetical protein
MASIVYDQANDRVIVDARSFRLRDPQWDDMRILPTAFDFAGNADPVAVATFQPGGSGTAFRLYEFAVNDEGFFTTQMPHGWKAGTNLWPHVHWSPGPRGNEEIGKTVAWALDYTIASIGGVFYTSRTIAMTGTCTGVDYHHEITSNAGSISMAGIGLSAMMLGRLYRTTGDSWASTTSGQLPLLLELDFHYEVDSLGSDEERVK